MFADDEISQNYVSLFLIEYVPFDSRWIAIHKKTQQPTIVREEHFCGICGVRYIFENQIAFSAVRDYAKKCYGVTSVCANHFFEIDKTNWLKLYECAVSEYRDKALNDYIARRLEGISEEHISRAKDRFDKDPLILVNTDIADCPIRKNA